MKKSQPGATTVWAKSKTVKQQKKIEQKKLASEESRGKDWEGGKVGVTLRHPFPFPDYRSACFARQIFCFALSNFPFSLFSPTAEPSPGLLEKGQGCIKRILFVTVF